MPRSKVSLKKKRKTLTNVAAQAAQQFADEEVATLDAPLGIPKAKAEDTADGESAPPKPAPKPVAVPSLAQLASSPSWGVKLDAGDELNPGMLLAELVKQDADEKPKKSGKKGAPKKAATKNKGKGAKAAGDGPVSSSKNEDADDELLSYDADEDDGADAGSSLVAAIEGLGTEDGDDTSLAAILAKRRALTKAGPESEFHAPGVEEEVTAEDLLGAVSEDPTFGQVRKQLRHLTHSKQMAEPTYEAKRDREERAQQYEATKKHEKKWVPQIGRNRKAEQVVLGEVKIHDQKAASNFTPINESFKPRDDFEKELAEITQAAGATEEQVKRQDILPVNKQLKDHAQKKQMARLKALMFREQQAAKRVNRIKSKTYRRIHRKAESKEKEALMARLTVENPELALQLKEEYEKNRAQLRLMRSKNARKKWTQAMQRYAKNDKSAQREITKQAQAAHDETMALRRAIKGADPDQSDSDAVDLSGSDNEDPGKKGGVARQTIGKARDLTIKEIKTLERSEGDLPTTGILGMNFMRDAIKRKREAAKEEAKGVLKELEGMDDKLEDMDAADSDDELAAKQAAADKAAAPEGGKKLREFTPEELEAARKDVDKMMENGESLETSVSAPLTVKGVAVAQGLPTAAAPTEPISQGGSSSSSSKPAKKGKKQVAAAGKASATKASVPEPAPATGLADPNPWLDATFQLGAGYSTSSTAAAVPKLAGEAAAPKLGPIFDPAAAEADADKAGAGKKGKKSKGAPKDDNDQKKKREEASRRFADENAAEREKDALAEVEDLLTPLNADSQAALEQRDLVRTAFVEGTHLEDFEAEQEDIMKKKDEAEERANAPLAGWGSWTGTGIKPRKGKGKGKGKGKEEEPPNKLPRVAVHEGATENAKYFVGKLPHGFQTTQQYDKTMNLPLGPEWNTMKTHQRNVKPKVFLRQGVVVPPLEHIRHLPAEERESAMKAWGANKVPKRLKSRI